MAFPAYLSIRGVRRGQFKGETTHAARRDRWMEIVAFEMGLASPRDLATGQASGHRQHQPVKIVKEWGAASPQLLTACATNEILTEVVIEFTRTHPNGEDYVYQRVRLSDAAIAEIDRFRGEAEAHTEAANPHELEEVEFIFRRIEVEDIDGSTMFADDWVSPA